MKLSDLNPHIRYARVHEAYKCFKKQVSKCYDCRMFYFSGVCGSVVVNGEKYNICNNTAVYLPPETEYIFNIESDGKITVLDFDLVNEYEHIKNSLGTATRENFVKNMVPEYIIAKELSAPIIRIVPQIGRMLSVCADNFIVREPFYRENSSAFLKICLLLLVKQDEKLSYSQLCENVLTYIQENYTDSELTNEAISEKFNYHPYHLSRIIRQETGKSLHQYLIYYRLQMAKNYLLTTKLDVSEIAWKCGFNSPAYFTKIFKENIKMTPREYRSLKIHTEI